MVKKLKNNSIEQQFCGRKPLVDKRGQKRMFRLLQANRKATVFEIITFYNGNITKANRWQQQKTTPSATPAKYMKLKLQFTKDKKKDNRRLWKKVACSESQFLMRHSEGRVRIGLRQHRNMDTSYLEFIVQAEGGWAILGRIFSSYILRRLVPIKDYWNAAVYLGVL